MFNKGHDSKHFCQYDIYDKGAQNYFTQFAHFIHCQGSFLGVEMSNLELRLNYSVNDPNAPAPKMGMPGGGPAGMQAAITAAQRGHEVTLYEKSDALGGALKFAQHINFKSDLYRFAQWQMTQIEIVFARSQKCTGDFLPCFSCRQIYVYFYIHLWYTTS